MGFGKEGIVSIVELIFYIPALVMGIIVCSRHGWNKASGWFYSVLLCGVRIIGAICQLASYNSSSSGLVQAYLIIDSVGISPLLFGTLGLLSRLMDWVHLRGGKALDVKIFRIIQLFIAIGLILGIAGGSSSSTPSGSDDHPSSSTTSKAGVVLYIIAFIGCLLVLSYTALQRSYVPKDEQKIFLAVIFSGPLIAVRLLYSIISNFAHNSHFSVVHGSVIIRAFMSVLEEILVVLAYLVLGFLLRKLSPDEQGEITQRTRKDPNHRKNRRRNRGRHERSEDYSSSTHPSNNYPSNNYPSNNYP